MKFCLSYLFLSFKFVICKRDNDYFRVWGRMKCYSVFKLFILVFEIRKVLINESCYYSIIINVIILL